MFIKTSIIVALLIVSQAVKGDPAVSPCDPILQDIQDIGKVGDDCMMPVPNNFYLEQTNSTPTGYQVNFLQQGVPNSRRFVPKISISDWNDRDGWSPSTFIAVSSLTSPIKNDVLLSWKGLKKVDGNGNEIPEDNRDFAERFGFASHMNINRSLDVDHPTILMDAETGEIFPHWIEEDRSYTAQLFSLAQSSNAEKRWLQDTVGHDVYDMVNDAVNNDQINVDNKEDTVQTLIIHPTLKLAHGRRYIVAIRNLFSASQVDENGDPLPIDPKDGFKIIRDNLPSDNPALFERKSQFQKSQIFELLEKHCGIKRDNLILAWDFTTSSLVATTEHLRYMRDEGYRLVAKNGLNYEITKVQDNYNTYVYRRIEGYFQSPLFLYTQFPSTRAMLVRDQTATTFIDKMRPLQNGWANVPFVIWIPRSLVEMDENTGEVRGISQGSIMQYGHGLFGQKEEPETGWLLDMANRNKYIIGCTEWWGLQKRDIKTVVEILLHDLAEFRSIPDRSSQGVLNQLIFTKFLKQSNFLNDQRVFGLGGKSVVETELVSGIEKTKNLFFYGVSLGGILGTVHMSLSEDIKIATFSVTGGPMSLLFPRNPAGSFILNNLLKIGFPKTSNRIFMLFLMNQFWDQCDPTGFADPLKVGGYFGKTPGEILSESPVFGKKKILYQNSPGDGEVNNIASYYLFRTLETGTMNDDPFEVYYKLDKSSYYVRNDGSRYYQENNSTYDKDTLLKVLNPNSNGTLTGYSHHISNVFHFKAIPHLIPFHNLPLSLKHLIQWDTHELPRLCSPGRAQAEAFFEEYIRQNRRGKFEDGKLWINKAPCLNGCWNLPIPDKTLLRPPKRTKRAHLQIQNV